MSEFKNVSSVGDLEVPILGRVVKAGETVEIPAGLDGGFREQPDVWALVEQKKENKE